MQSVYGLDPEQYRIFSRWHKIITVLLALLLALLWLLGYGPGAFRDCARQNVASNEIRNPTTVPNQAVPATPQVDANTAPATPVESTALSEKVTKEVTPGESTASLSPSVAETSSPVLEQSLDTPLNVRVYFRRDKYQLPNDASSRLANVVTYLKQNPTARARIFGFHDGSGRPSYNVDLANKRAKAVAQALERAGIGAAQIAVQQSSQTPGSGKPEEARRVELKVTK